MAEMRMYTELCGCTTHVDRDGAYIVWCPKHEAVDEMEKALEKMLEIWYLQKTEQFHLARAQAQAALVSARKTGDNEQPNPA